MPPGYARMWPRAVPEWVRSNPFRAAECSVYDALAQQLDSNFVVFYSRPWLGLRPDGEEIDGECDFLVAHPDLGILAIEVKGGEVRYDASKDEWWSRDGEGFHHRIKNPVGQAVRAKHEILRRLQASHDWSPRFVRARHGVILPGSGKPGSDLGLDMPLSIFCFFEQFTHVGAWIRQRMQGDGERELPLGQDGIAALEKMLASSFVLRAPLRMGISQDESAIEVLTEQQCILLRALEENDRLLVRGPAGSGKTVLMIEMARRAAARGDKTLVTCQSEPLARHIRRVVGDIDQLKVASFRELAVELTRKAGEALPLNEEDADLEEALAECLLSALSELPEERFDAILVDEAQDFGPRCWATIELALRGPSSRLFAFMDANQKLYPLSPQTTRQLPDAKFKFPLSRNLRNTRLIFELACHHYEGPPVLAAGPRGREAERVVARSWQEVPRCLRDVVGRLVKQEGIKPEAIAVIHAHEADRALLCPGDVIGRWKAVRAGEGGSDAIVVDTAQRFKGLESRVVVLVASGHFATLREHAYVALTRAKTHLILIGTAADLPLLEQSASKGENKIAGETTH